MKKRTKNDLPVFDSNHDFLAAFEKEKKNSPDNLDTKRLDPVSKENQNKHGLAVLDDLPEEKERVENPVEENFAQLLEDSFKKSRSKPMKKSSPMPLKKRLKRYPAVEVELDLHGYTAIGAQVKARSFILSCKQEGYFTVGIIVGKGLHSDLGPVLPDVVEDVLREMKKQNQIIWYDWDKKKKSKSGAVIVFLKQFERFE